MSEGLKIEDVSAAFNTWADAIEKEVKVGFVFVGGSFLGCPQLGQYSPYEIATIKRVIKEAFCL